MAGLILFALVVYALAKARAARRVSRSIDRVAAEIARGNMRARR